MQFRDWETQMEEEQYKNGFPGQCELGEMNMKKKKKKDVLTEYVTVLPRE